MTSRGVRRRVIFVTGTRADFGKLKPLIREAAEQRDLDISIFVTGMHLLERYGSTWDEVRKSDLGPIHPFINQNLDDSMDAVLGKTVLGFSDYVKATNPDLIVVHGDRVEALACASVGALANVLVAHVEGGEVTGTVDETIRHAVTKLSHVHLVANDDARQALLQLGELPETIHVIGSPDIDVMNSPDLPSIEEVKLHYRIPFDDFGILLFHPVTSELDTLSFQTSEVLSAVTEGGLPLVVLYPNNDRGSDVIFRAYEQLGERPDVRIFPSIRFEAFLTLLRHAAFLLGNSSAGIREAPHYGTPVINVGSRQDGRLRAPTIRDVPAERQAIRAAITWALGAERTARSGFGDGESARHFAALIQGEQLWATSLQKRLVRRPDAVEQGHAEGTNSHD